MFHEDIHPRNILKALMVDSMQTLERLLDVGFPLDAVPPHHTSVYASLVDSEVEVCREGMHVLTHEDKDTWTPLMLFRLDTGRNDERYPLGSFLGFVGSSENSKDAKFFGILMSPTGDQAMGMYTNIAEEGEREFIDLWDHPYDLAPHLNQRYTPSDEGIIH